MKTLRVFLLLSGSLYASLSFAGTTGKISGTVKDARTGDPLPAANVTIEGTLLGGATRVDGYYVILNVPPGRYKVNVSLVGFRPTGATNVKVDIDQTTTQDFSLNEEAVTGEEITVVGARPVVQRDVAASRANIEIVDIQKLPINSVVAAVGLQAGVQGLSVRGGFASETAFMVDGTMLRDERTNSPYTSISLLAVQDIQLQTGGFSAEYGNVRSGVINVVTKEGPKTNYTLSFQGRLAPTQPKHFGSPIYDKNSYWIRPYLDDAVAWTGTQNGAWDTWTQRQYPSFEGWNSVAQKRVGNADPNDDLTPEALQRLFTFERRKIAEIQEPDYDFDIAFGGPVPFVAEEAGNLRFFASYRQLQSMYLIPLSRDAYRDYNGSLKLTSDVRGGMKLTIEGMWGKITGTNSNNQGNPGIFQSPESIGAVLNRVSYIDTRIFATDYWAPTTTTVGMFGAKLSQAIGPTTYYDASISFFQTEYSTHVGTMRDTSKIYKFGNNYYVDESPFNFTYLPNPANGLADIRFGVGFSNSRDTSVSKVFTGRFDLTSQIDKINQIKVGGEFIYTDQDIKYGLYDAFLPDAVYSVSYSRFPMKGALYARDKLEFEGMVAELGLRMDYLNPGGEWFVYDPYTSAFKEGSFNAIDTLLPQAKTEKQLLFSPRLGISFPITDYAKIFFNYGHFYQQQAVDNLYLLRPNSSNQLVRIGDPNAPLPRTVAYELGYEHSLLDEYLIRVAAYYKDIAREPLLVSYSDRRGTVAYSKYTSQAYRDIRGFEVTLSRNRGSWVQGFVNYTYDVRTSGYFGTAANFQSTVAQADYQKTNVYQEKPIPQPFARLNIDFFTPPDLGPGSDGISLLGDWRINFLGAWSSGYYFTWDGGANIPGVENNVQWADYWNLDMRITKNFRIGKQFNLQLFADISNVFNYKYMTTYGFVTSADYTQYMQSLHLPAFDPTLDSQVGYVNIPGDDRGGSYRQPGVEYQPIIAYRTYSAIEQIPTPETRPFYYAADQGIYYQWVNGAWQQVESGRLQQVLDNKAYIDMPNQETFNFLNPRRVFWGLRFSMDF